jgi:hypothetical protein
MGIVPSGSFEDRLVVPLFFLALTSPLVLGCYQLLVRSILLVAISLDPHVFVDAYLDSPCMSGFKGPLPLI